MSKTIEEKIAIMQHYANGGEVECLIGTQWKILEPKWEWSSLDYRIKQTNIITIERWLCLNSMNRYTVVEGCREYLKYINFTKLKMLDTYKVEL